MTSTTRIKPVSIGFLEEVEIYPGLTIPAGTYPGRSKQTTIQLLKGPRSTPPVYSIELTAEQITDFGSTVARGSDFIEFDVTKFFNLGLAYVR